MTTQSDLAGNEMRVDRIRRARRCQRWKLKVFAGLRGALVCYIVFIGIFAIEELQRRENALHLIQEQEREVAASLNLLHGHLTDATSEQQSSRSAELADLEQQSAALAGLRARLTTLILSGPVRSEIRPSTWKFGDRPRRDSLKDIECDLVALHQALPDGRSCARDAPAPSVGSSEGILELLATINLKRVAEQRSSGDIFAPLVIIAALGGALILLYLPGNHEKRPLRAVFRGLGGGVVCYLLLRGASVPFTEQALPAQTSAATGAFVGLLGGMFATKVFQVVARNVESWLDKLEPQAKSGEAAGNGERPTQQSGQQPPAPNAARGDALQHDQAPHEQTPVKNAPITTGAPKATSEHVGGP